ncbi:MAG: 16S rRNA (cytosine(967)-C(5))-methyltransferase RsmB [Bacilli bacterium]|nr:16S rRNA (cytosine(967)-C(5))-methyltransferase RsmB [Bacilli bacterium]
MYQLAVLTITKIINEAGYINLVVSDSIEKEKLTDHERRLFTKIVYGTVEKYLLLDYYLKPYISGKRVKPFFKNLLRMGVYMIFFMNIANHFVVNELVKIAKKKDFNSSKMVNAVLRSIIRDGLREIDTLDQLEYLSIKYSYPLELVKELARQYHKDIESILNADYEVNYNTFRINTLKVNPIEVEDYLKQENIEYLIDKTTLWVKTSLIDSALFKEGKIIPQDASSQKVGLVVNPKKNSRILDACSAPGGKACHMAAIMENQGEIVCLDVHEHKLALINHGANKAGVSILKPMLMDARKYEDNQLFDYVVIDAPCSGLGVMDHKVDLKYHMTLNSMNELVGIQKEILNNLSSLVKKEGYLTYSTCTINKNENEYQVNEFLKTHPEYEKVEEYQLLPNNLGDGFYICKLQRKA